MIKNYLIVALRNLTRQFTYSFINILGLAVGLACSLVIFLYVFSEWSYDRHFNNGERIYRVGVSFFNLGKFAKGPEVLKDHLEKDFPGIEAFTTFDKTAQEKIFINDQFYTEAVYYVDSVFFRVFSYDFAAGDGTSALNHSNTVVISESIARKFFGSEDALGKMIGIGKQKLPHVVTGVVREPKPTSHLKALIWARLGSTSGRYGSSWSAASLYNYVLLEKNSNESDLRQALDRVVEQYVYPASGAPSNGISLDKYREDENSVKFYIQPFRDIYLKSKLSLEVSPGGNESNMRVFAVVAVFILLLAAVNFVNLATARASRRAKEVGVRKSLGTSRGKLVGQFLFESVLISVLAMVVALGFAELFLLGFYWITGQSLMVNLWTSGFNLLIALMLAVVIGLTAGVYPAFYLTSFTPVKVLKGLMHEGGGSSFRNGLVVFQFAISLVLIICSGVIFQQLDYMKTKDLGFDTQNVLSINDIPQIKGNAKAFKDALLQHSATQSASLHTGQPGNKSTIMFYTFQTPEMETPLTINTYFGDHNYPDVMGFKLVSGRSFDKDILSDSAAVLLNEAAVSALNLGEDPIGKEVNKGTKVIGVVADFHWESLRSAIAPVVIMLKPDNSKKPVFSQLGIRFETHQAQSLLKFADEKWKAMGAAEPLQYHFLDENFGDLLKKEAVFGKAIGFFTGLAIMISCLGVFGLAAFTTEQRKKEIGIRKVFGASLAGIYMMLNRQYVKLMLLAMFFSVPLAWWFMRTWLDNFSYKIEMSPAVFVASGIAQLLIAVGSVGYLILRVAKLNPTTVLKDE